jgi:hypothetical protein
MEAQLSAGIVRLKAAALNIPQRDCCGEPVKVVLIPLIAEEKRGVIPSGSKQPGLRHLEGSAIDGNRLAEWSVN